MADYEVLRDADLAVEVTKITAATAARIADTMAMTAMHYGQHHFFEVC